MRAVAVFLLVFLALAGLASWYARTTTVETIALVAAPATAVTVEPAQVTGTLTYYSNNQGGEAPYVLYRVNGSIVTKTLTFDSSSSCSTASGTYPCLLISDALREYYGGGPVTVTGDIVAEHIVVETLALAAS